MILEMHDICKDYPMGKSVNHILKHIDLEVEEGEYLAIMGPSGSGKTTLLKIAKVDAGAMRVDKREVRAAEVVRRAVAPLATAMDLRDVNLVLDLDESAVFQGDAPWTAEAVENVAKNCMEHTPAGGCVRVQASEDAVAFRLSVADTGPGIAAEDLPRLFERFYRGAGSEGFGIGLALAQALVTAQGGTLRAGNDRETGGARFDLTFPKVVV